MKLSSAGLVLLVCASAFAQNGQLMNGNAIWNGVGLTFETVLYPPIPPMAEGFVGGNITDSSAIHRYIFYNSQHKYFGYDLHAEAVPNTEFYKLTIRPMTVVDPKRLEIDHPESWTMVPLSGYPAPQTLKSGDMVELELFKNPTTGQKIFEHIRVAGQKGRENQYILGVGDVLFVNAIQHPDASGVLVVRSDGTLQLSRFGTVKAAGLTIETLTANLENELSRYFMHPKVNVRIMRIAGSNAQGVARDLSVDDVELRIIAPQVSLNGKHIQLATYEDGVVGPAVWFYLPDHGRYILSLLPRPQLGFVKAGEVRGSTLTFSIDGETIALASGVDIAPGYAPYNLYVLRQSSWRPPEEALTGTFLMGYSERAEALLQDGSAKEYQIATGDVLFINVLHFPDFTGTATVRPDGFILLRSVGEVRAVGLTPGRLARAIVDRLAEKHIDHPDVNVQIVRVVSKKFYVNGEVRKAGAYSLNTPKTVLEAIIEAGGLNDFAKTKGIYILRGRDQKFPFNYQDVRKGKSLEQNIILKDGDVIVVP